MNESQIKKAIADYLNYSGIVCWYNITGGVYDPKIKRFRKLNSEHSGKGSSDILGLLPGGRFLAIEVKTPDKKNNVSEDQKEFIDKINKNGGLAFVAISVDDVIRELDGIEEKAKGQQSFNRFLSQ